MRSKSKRIGVRVEPRTWDALTAAAALEGRTPSDLARFWIELELGLADEAGPVTGKAKNPLASGPAKPFGSRIRKKPRQARKDA